MTHFDRADGAPTDEHDPAGLVAIVASMVAAKRVAPIFPVRELGVALAHYARLGFATHPYEGGGYGFARLDGCEIHLGVVPVDRPTTPSSAYLFVDDADELASIWTAAGVDLKSPEDTEWGQHEGVVVDPDGNIIRFGSPLRSPHHHPH